MKKIVALLPIALFLGVSAWSLRGVPPASATCYSSGITLSLASGSVTRRADNTFEYVLLLDWSTGSALSVLDVVPTTIPEDGFANYGVDHVTFTPNNLFLGSKTGSLLIRVTGHVNITDPKRAYVGLKAHIKWPVSQCSQATHVQTIG